MSETDASAPTGAHAAPQAGKLAAPGLSDGAVRASLWLLLVIYTLNFVDRQVVAVLGENIKADLKLNDGQFGLLGGLAFALFYTVLGIPIARFAERGNRAHIISGALAVWSGFTALCGLAASFAQILAFRVGVGVGEAGCTPPAHSLISDYVRPEKRASALALYSMGVPIGTFLGFALGAVIAERFGWRTAFFVAGAPGIALALIAFFVLKEPRKLGLASARAPATHFPAALRELAGKPSYWYAVLAATFVSVLAYGHAYFLPAYLARTHGMGLQERGIGFAIMVLIAGVFGTWLGGQLTDRIAKRDARAYASLPGLAFLIGMPFFFAAILIPAGIYQIGGASIASGYLALVLIGAPTCMNSVWYGPLYAAVQTLAAPRTRATAVAIMFFVLNLLGLGFGPTIIGRLSDHFAARLFNSADPAAYAAACPPGGRDPLCLAAAADGLEQSLLTSAAAGLLALLSFALMRATIRQDLSKAAQTA
ncbi:MAG: MFS transporter [Hyphomonadaceae bacterium]|nr:MFS transporter [Hyphomonadaceae bacterium]